MASIEVQNPVEIQLSLGNLTYRGPAGQDGSQGPAGKSAYQVAVDNGFVGSESEWLASLKGADGAPGQDGVIGVDGKSAYEVAIDNGFVGTQAQWLASLKGADGAIGATGATGPAGQDGATPIKGVDYFTQQDIADFIAQVPPTDLSNYKPTLHFTSGDILTQEQKDILLDLAEHGQDYPHYNGFSGGSNEWYFDTQNLPYIITIDGWLINNTTISYYKNRSTEQFYYKIEFYTQLRIDENQINGGRYFEWIYTTLDANEANTIKNQGWTTPIIGKLKTSSPLNVASSLSSDATIDKSFQYIKENYATKAEVETAIRGAETGLLKRAVVQELPVSDIDDNTIYMVPKTGSTGDIYDEYLYVSNVWEHIGSTDVDLTGYATEDYVNNRKFPYLDLKKLIQQTGVRWNYSYSPPFWRTERDASNPYITELFNIFEYALNNNYNLENYSGIYFDGYIYYANPNMDGYTTISIQNWQNGLWGYTLEVSITNGYLVIRNQQNFKPTLYDAGTGISISNSTISINTQYLTNSDILAIWNGETE